MEGQRPFKIGDLVECVEGHDGDTVRLVDGHCYTVAVVNVFSDTIQVHGVRYPNGSPANWNESRFRLFSELHGD